MTPLLYDASESVEGKLCEAIRDNGGTVQPRREVKKTAEDEEQYWSVMDNDEEAFWFCVAIETAGKRTLMMVPNRNLADSRLFDEAVNALEANGARRLETLTEREASR